MVRVFSKAFWSGHQPSTVLLRFADALKSDDLRKIAIERGAQ